MDKLKKVWLACSQTYNEMGEESLVPQLAIAADSREEALQALRTYSFGAERHVDICPTSFSVGQEVVKGYIAAKAAAMYPKDMRGGIQIPRFMPISEVRFATERNSLQTLEGQEIEPNLVWALAELEVIRI